MKSQGQWLHLVKTDSCESCHQLGNQYTRTIPAMFSNFDSPAQAWDAARPVRASRQRDGRTALTQLGPDTRHGEFGDWTTRIAKASCPPKRRRVRKASSATSSSRNGIGLTRRLICMTKSRPTSATPTVNANGLIYGSPEESRDYLPVLDPVQHASAR